MIKILVGAGIALVDTGFTTTLLTPKNGNSWSGSGILKAIDRRKVLCKGIK